MQRLFDCIGRISLLQGTLSDLERTFHSKEDNNEALRKGIRPTFSNDKEYAAAIYLSIRRSFQPNPPTRFIDLMLRFSEGSPASDVKASFHSTVLHFFVGYLCEALDDRGLVESFLVKFKRKVEWFIRDAARQDANEERVGEAKLNRRVNEYLFEYGAALEIVQEPKSVSGKIDFLISVADRKIYVESKVFDGERRGVSYLASGVNQLLTYLNDYCASDGYLMIFNSSGGKDLVFDLDSSANGIWFLKVGQKSIFILVIDINEWGGGASTRGRIQQVRIGRADLLGVVDK